METKPPTQRYLSSDIAVRREKTRRLSDGALLAGGAFYQLITYPEGLHPTQDTFAATMPDGTIRAARMVLILTTRQLSEIQTQHNQKRNPKTLESIRQDREARYHELVSSTAIGKLIAEHQHLLDVIEVAVAEKLGRTPSAEAPHLGMIYRQWRADPQRKRQLNDYLGKNRIGLTVETIDDSYGGSLRPDPYLQIKYQLIGRHRKGLQDLANHLIDNPAIYEINEAVTVQHSNGEYQEGILTDVRSDGQLLISINDEEKLISVKHLQEWDGRVAM